MSVAEGLKKIAFLVPKPGMDDAAFRRYWRGTHGPVVAGSPDYGRWRLRYVQNHVLGAGPVGTPFDFAGMAEFWLPGNAPNEDAFAATPIYRDRIRVDELNFIDMDQTISMTAREEVAKAGTGAAKLVVLSAIAPGLPQGEFRRRYSNLATNALAVGEISGLIAGWTASHLIEGTYRLPGGRPSGAIAVDCVEEFWFAREADREALFRLPAWRDLFVPPADSPFGPRQSFMAEEIVFFDAAQA